jgi:NAD/NADP transhydrogenase alpha subunit
METLILLLFVFVLAAFLGFELIQKVPSQLHTPLMSGSNAISGITVVGCADHRPAWVRNMARSANGSASRRSFSR